jgi:hypothetical protein
MIIVAGQGKLGVCPSTIRCEDGEEFLALSIRKLDGDHSVGERVPDSDYSYNPDTDIVIICESLEAVRVFQDAINHIALRLQSLMSTEPFIIAGDKAIKANNKSKATRIRKRS